MKEELIKGDATLVDKPHMIIVKEARFLDVGDRILVNDHGSIIAQEITKTISNEDDYLYVTIYTKKYINFICCDEMVPVLKEKPNE